MRRRRKRGTKEEGKSGSGALRPSSSFLPSFVASASHSGLPTAITLAFMSGSTRGVGQWTQASRPTRRPKRAGSMVQEGQQLRPGMRLDPGLDGLQREERSELATAFVGVPQLAGDALGPQRRLQSQALQRSAGLGLDGLPERLGQLALPIHGHEIQETLAALPRVRRRESLQTLVRLQRQPVDPGGHRGDARGQFSFFDGAGDTTGQRHGYPAHAIDETRAADPGEQDHARPDGHQCQADKLGQPAARS